MGNYQNDLKTANAFAKSWNKLPEGSVYTKNQLEDWMRPLEELDFKGKRILELGCGNASLMMHVAKWNPEYIEGVDLGKSVISARKNMGKLKFNKWMIKQTDMIKYKSRGFDIVYCVGVLHHLKEPKLGFDAVIRNVKRGGLFHCWVYGKEGNGFVIYFIDPIRKIVSGLPWWIIKYVIATPLAIPFYIYANSLSRLTFIKLIKKLPLYRYCLWISKQDFAFFRHVAFDQLVAPQTSYFDRQTIESWMLNDSRIDRNSIYLISRNANSWKFGGKVL